MNIWGSTPLPYVISNFILMLKRPIALTFMLVTSLAFLGGCGSQGSDLDENGIVVDEMPQDRRIGVIEELDNDDTVGTHRLRLDDGDTILLQSAAINLDDDKYSDVGVEVRGVITYTKGNKPLMEVTNIDVLEDYVIEDTKAAQWTEYDGSLFSIRYRDDFEMEKSDGEVTFTLAIEPEDEDAEPSDEPMEDIFTIFYAPKEEDEDLLGYLGLESDGAEHLLPAGLARSKVGVLNLDALKKEEDGVVTFYVEGENNFFELSFEVSDHENALKHENLFYEMLGSFDLKGDVPEGFEEMDNSLMESRTLDVDSVHSGEASTQPQVYTVDLSNYESLASDTVGFSLQYPKSWYFEGSNSSESGVSQVYNFGDESFDEGGSALVTMSVMSSDPSTSTVTADGKSLGFNDKGGTVDVVYKGNGRYFRFSGPKNMQQTLINMAASVSE